MPWLPTWLDLAGGQPTFARVQRNAAGQIVLKLNSPCHDAAVPEGPDVILTGEYTPFNLLHQGGGLSAMFDFGDGLVGPREYDWLGPLCFLAAGDASRVDAFFDGYHGRAFDRSRRETLLRLLLLHRYSNLKAQITVPGWQAAPAFATLAALIRP